MKRDGKPLEVLAVVIGAAHTNDMVRLLKQRNRSVAVITPNGMMMSHPTLLSGRQMERKYKNSPIGDDAFSSKLRAALVKSMHPQPVLLQPWFETKAQLYARLDELTVRAFGGGAGDKGPPTGPKSLVGAPSPDPKRWLSSLPDSAFKGDEFQIDRTDIHVLEENGKPDSLLFAVILHPEGANPTKLWVRTNIAHGQINELGDDSVENGLRKALDEVKSEKKHTDASKESKDASEELQAAKDTAFISRDVRASFSSSKESLVANAIVK